MDSSRPEVIIKDKNLKDLILTKKSHGLNLKAISEITNENISHCKDLMLMTVELRHLDGIKGTFYLSDTEYIALAYLHAKGKPAEQIIYSNVRDHRSTEISFPNTLE